MIYVGIDPGLDGALAAVFEGEVIDLIDMPVFVGVRRSGTAREVNAFGVFHWLMNVGSSEEHKREKVYVMLEQSGSRPGEGVSSAHRNGVNWGIVAGVLAATKVSHVIVTPQSWKKAMGVKAEKEHARMMATQLLPNSAWRWQLKKHHGRAEAALIALHARNSAVAIPSNNA